MDANIRYLQFASTWFKIAAVIFFFLGGLLTVVSILPLVLGTTLATAAYSPGVAILGGALGLVSAILQALGVIFIAFVLYTVGRVLDLLIDMGEEILDWRRIQFERSAPPQRAAPPRP